jgi:hypothetical protein
MKSRRLLRDRYGRFLVSVLLIVLVLTWIACTIAIFVMAERHAFNDLVTNATGLFGGALAGLGALFAAIIAYTAAMRQIHFTREVDARAFSERTHNLLLKVEYGTRTLIVHLTATISEMERSDVGGAPVIFQDLRQLFAIALPQYMMEGWDNLSLLPQGAIKYLRLLSLQLFRAQRFAEDSLARMEDPDYDDFPNGYLDFTGQLTKLYEEVLEAADLLTIEIESELEPLFDGS